MSESRASLCGVAAVLVLSAAVCAWPRSAAAQSGRRNPPPVSPVPTPTPAPDAQGESESVPRGGAKKQEGVVVSLVVVEHDGTVFSADPVVRRDVVEAFLRRLGQSDAVSVSPAGRGSRKEARDRAKAEREAYVVHFELEEDSFTSSGGVGRADPRSLVIRTYVYAPKTGDLKFTDTTHQRPYRESATVGGVRIPVPGRRVERYPSELQLQQAARDAADRLMARFSLILPPDR